MSDVQQETQVGSAEVKVEEKPSLLDSLIDQGRLVRRPDEKARAKELIGELVNQVLDQKMTVDGDLEKMISARIAAIDELLTKQLNLVMHSEPFQRLEGSWRGLQQLVQKTETGERLKIRVMNVSKKELLKDARKAAEFDQTMLFKKIYESEYGMFGGTPYGLLVGDFDFGRHPEDVELLTNIAGVAASGHSPFVAAAAPEMLNLDTWTELENPRDLAKIFDSIEYAEWKTFRQKEDSRYVALTLPRYLARLPYGEKNVKVNEFRFEEDVSGRDHSKYLWANSAYAYAQRITDAFARHSWCTAIRGVEGGGLVEDLPIHRFETPEGETAMKIPTEVAITDRREKELSDLGFLPLVHCKGTTYAAFFGGQTCNLPKKYIEDDATENAQLSARLPYIMAVSRIAHYLKSIVRDKIGGFATKDEIQKYLERWISQYVLLNDNATAAQKAKKPLREARIVVEEVPRQPGMYRAVAHLRPHFQLEGLNVSLRLVAKLPTPAK